MPITRESANRFRVRLDRLERGVLGGPRRSVGIDPYLLGRALAEVMRACGARSATGRALVWNEYRVVLSRDDFDALAPLGPGLDGDLEAAAELLAEERGAERVGPIRVSVVADESDELRAGEGVVRVAFVAERRGDALGLETVRDDAPPPRRSAPRLDPKAPAAVAYRLAWAGGEAVVPAGATVVLGRPHPGEPAGFVPLEGASARINKQQLELVARDACVIVRRLASANPVEVDGVSLAAGAEAEVAVPASISLSKGDLVLRIARR